MSLKNFSLAFGMSAMGSLWVTPACVFAQVEPAAVSPMPGPQAPSKTYTVLLLTNGRVLRGTIAEDATGTQYVLTQKGGSIHFPKRDAERAFTSMEELYRYKRDRIPEGDADEQLKLAKWCLEQHLDEQAKFHLQKVLAVSPGFVPAQRMVASIDFARENVRAGGPTVDNAVALTSGEMPAAQGPGRTVDQDPRVAKARREMLKSGGIPVVFDLPPNESVKRAQEFARGVHGVLQQNCVKCHGDNHTGEFRLITVKNRHDLTPDVVKANLDAVLPLVNRETPDASRLLAASLVPHGGSRRPVLKGSNDPAYLMLAAWVGRLRSTPAPNDPGVVFAGGGAAQGPSTGERFGADRDPEAAAAAGLPTARAPKFTAIPGDPRAAVPTMPQGGADIFQGQSVSVPKNIVSPYVAPGAAFPEPYQPGSPSNPGAVPTIPKAGLPNVQAPAAAKPAAAPMPDDDEPAPAAAPKPKRKRAAIDPAILEKMLKARQAPAPAPMP